MVLLSSRPSAHASVRNIRVSAFKARPVLRLIQGKSYEEAVETLKFCDRGAADVIAKCLSSAAANAEHNEGIDPEETFVSACFADEGTTMRRWRARARGRAARINKRTCHITIQLVRYTPEELTERATREASSSSASIEARRRRVAASRLEDADSTEEVEAEVEAGDSAEDSAGDSEAAEEREDEEAVADTVADTEKESPAVEKTAEDDEATTSSDDDKAAENKGS